MWIKNDDDNNDNDIIMIIIRKRSVLESFVDKDLKKQLNVKPFSGDGAGNLSKLKEVL